jgi:hypothetical protein
MSVEPIELMGGESIYCINESQLKKAFELTRSNSETGFKINEQIEYLENTLNRNERAALAFVLIDRLLRSPVN